MTTAAREFGDKLGIGRAQVCFVPIPTTNLVVFGNVQLALVEGDPVGLVQACQNLHRSLSFAGVVRIGQGDHFTAG